MTNWITNWSTDPVFIVVYFQVRKGVDENQYVPNWLPGKGNVLMHDTKPTLRKVLFTVRLKFISNQYTR